MLATSPRDLDPEATARATFQAVAHSSASHPVRLSENPLSSTTHSSMGLLRLVVLVACLMSSAAAFAPPSMALRSAVAQQRSASITMMPKAATKPMRVNARNREYNKMYRSEMRTRVKRVRKLISHRPQILGHSPPARPEAAAACFSQRWPGSGYCLLIPPLLCSFASRCWRRRSWATTRLRCRLFPRLLRSSTRMSSVASCTRTLLPARSRGST